MHTTPTHIRAVKKTSLKKNSPRFRTHTCLRMFCLLRGTFQLYYKRNRLVETRRVQAPAFLLWNGAIAHRMDIISQTGEYYLVETARERINKTISAKLDEHLEGRPCFVFRSPATLLSRLVRLVSYMESEIAADTKILSQNEDDPDFRDPLDPENMVNILLRQLLGLVLRNVSGADTRIKQCVNFIRTNIHDLPELDELAQRTGLSRKHFEFLFKRQTGESPHRFIRSVQCQQARRLLRETRLTHSEIAARCGFSDHTGFSRIFRTQYGISPSAYRAGN